LFFSKKSDRHLSQEILADFQIFLKKKIQHHRCRLECENGRKRARFGQKWPKSVKNALFASQRGKNWFRFPYDLSENPIVIQKALLLSCPKMPFSLSRGEKKVVVSQTPTSNFSENFKKLLTKKHLRTFCFDPLKTQKVHL